jgi:hypothetical protein
VMAVASFFLPTGMAAAALTLPWLVLTILMALSGLLRFLPRRLFDPAEISISFALIYVAVAGGNLVTSRLGAEPLGFGDTIILLTAVHFHYAGFAAPLLAGLLGRRLATTSPGLHYAVVAAVAVLVAGIPLVGLGITFSPPLALVGAISMSLGLLIVAVLQIGWIVLRSGPILTRLLLFLSSLSVLAGMSLACTYAYSIVARRLIIDIPYMARTHGMVNALGFTLCGLLGWCFSGELRRRD